MGRGLAMDIERLREFAEVAKLRSFTRAAEELGVSQPSLSRHLASLEKELGFMLLERDTHGGAHARRRGGARPLPGDRGRV